MKSNDSNLIPETNKINNNNDDDESLINELYNELIKEFKNALYWVSTLKINIKLIKKNKMLMFN